MLQDLTEQEPSSWRASENDSSKEDDTKRKAILPMKTPRLSECYKI